MNLKKNNSLYTADIEEYDIINQKLKSTVNDVGRNFGTSKTMNNLNYLSIQKRFYNKNYFYIDKWYIVSFAKKSYIYYNIHGE